MGNFYEIMTGTPKPFWLSYECPKCKGRLKSKQLCHHGDLYSCTSCEFEQFAEYQGEEDECPTCAPWWNHE